MNPKFLTYATMWITGLLTEVRKGGKGMVGGRGQGNFLL